MSRYEAVVFDLWGTLVDELTHPEANRIVYRRKLDETADLLGLDRDDFASAWSATAADRMVGRSPSTEATLSHICRQLGAEPGVDRIRAAARIRCEYVRGALSPRPGAVETISTLKESGYRVGLISNCTEEVSRLWRSTPFAPLVDTAVLSSDAGLAKPNPRIYELAVRGLGVRAERCLYVGDGSDGELSGAAKAGDDGRAHSGALRPGGRRPRSLGGGGYLGDSRRARPARVANSRLRNNCRPEHREGPGPGLPRPSPRVDLAPAPGPSLRSGRHSSVR